MKSKASPNQNSTLDLEQRVKQLSCSKFYPHPTEVITTIETHISVVFLTGLYAYKLKKPVNFGFLNFSELEKRKHFCHLEVSLNQRTAPDLYIDCLPVYLDEKNQLSLAPTDTIVDYLVRMHQFDPNQVLGRYLADDYLTAQQTKQLVNNIAQLHLSAESCDAQLPYGSFEDVVFPMTDNFPHLFNTFEDPEIQYRLNYLKDWTNFTHQSLRTIIEERKQNGFVKACHGDMHLDNITLVNEKPMLFDGIEFNEQFRWIDVISDLAFLMVDCDYRQQQLLKRNILQLYIQQTGDYNGLAVLTFYLVYRAMVRAKITALRYHQLPKEGVEAQQNYQKALTYLKQAEDYAYELKTPKIILMQGVSGSGKSYYAQQLLQLMDAIIISSDIERKRLYGIAFDHRVSESEKVDLYSAEMSQKTYQRLQDITKQLIRNEYNVIVDATFLKTAHRKAFEAIASEYQVELKVISIQTDNLRQVENNISERQATDLDPSDADIKVMRQQLKVNQPPEKSAQTFVINPNSDILQAGVAEFLFD